jgi:hypothetical protein
MMPMTIHPPETKGREQPSLRVLTKLKNQPIVLGRKNSGREILIDGSVLIFNCQWFFETFLEPLNVNSYKITSQIMGKNLLITSTPRDLKEGLFGQVLLFIF